MAKTKDQGRSPAIGATRWAIPVVGLAAIGLAYPVSVGVVVVYETYSDYTCMVLYRDSGPAEQWTYARGPYREYLPDPGYSCNYLVNGEWIEIREELPVAKGFASAASITVAAIAFAGLLVHYRRQPTADLYP